MFLERRLPSPAASRCCNDCLFAAREPGRCRLNFVVQNKSDTALDSMKLDLAVFDPDGAIKRRLLTEMGPMRPLKTVVRTFVIDMECREIRSLLVNDVVICTPGNTSDCLDELTLSSRLKGVRFYK
jgi:hypothetical protein